MASVKVQLSYGSQAAPAGSPQADNICIGVHGADGSEGWHFIDAPGGVPAHDSKVIDGLTAGHSYTVEAVSRAGNTVLQSPWASDSFVAQDGIQQTIVVGGTVTPA